MSNPTLYIVATPLGNAGDLSPRAAEILSRSEVVLAEDTRRAGMLFKRLGLASRGFVSFYDHNEEGRIAQVLGWLEEGKDIALISDAGTPLLSDPGYRLVRACRDRGFRVSPVPGASAPVAALSACGLPPYPFTFLGFLPRSKNDIRKLFASFADVKTTLVFFERKSRLNATLALALEALGDRECCVARELTKEHEEFILGTLSGLASLEEELRGEITVVVGPPAADGKSGEDDVLAVLARESEAGGKPKRIAARVAEQCPGWTAKAVYELMNRDKA